MATAKPKLAIIDGNALIHRAFHALPPLTTKQGELVNAVFGFSSILLKALGDIKPEYVAVAFDMAKKTFRDDLYQDYKATRVKAPDELYAQIPRVKEVVKALNMPIFGVEGFEADDVVGTIAKLAKKENIETIIVTGDNDALQLVDDNTKVYTLRRGVKDTVTFAAKQVKEKYGFSPEQLIDYKGLAGDASDNIPGVPGVGEKTATGLIKDFGSVEKLYQALKAGKAAALSAKLRAKLLQYEEQARLSKKLATIVRDVPLQFVLQQCKMTDYDRNKLLKLFSELGFKSLLSRLPKSDRVTEVSGQARMFALREEPTETQKLSADYQLVETNKQLKLLLLKLARQKEFAIDTETTSEKVMAAELVGISLCFQAGVAYFITADLALGNTPEAKKLRSIIADPIVKKIGHNLKFDYLSLKGAGIKMDGMYFDTMIASYLLNTGSRRHNLNDLAFSELGYEMMTFETLVGKGKDKKKITEVDKQRLAFYASEDADYTFRLKKIFAKKLKNEPALEKLFHQMEMPLSLVLALMEENGIKIDVKFLRELSLDFAKDIDKLTYEIYKLAGSSAFNINSTQQLSDILFNKLKIDTKDIKRTTTGYSTAQSELDKLRSRHAIIPLIDQYREYRKLKTTYVDALPKLVNKQTGRLHGSFNQTITATGRLSSSDPNLQNIPIRTELGREIRRAFVAGRGAMLLSADYSQIDLRVLAHASGDNIMLASFNKDEDIHRRTASLVFGKDIKKITPEERRIAKTVNFGVIYGMGAYGLARTINMPPAEAQVFINNYFKTYPGIKKYMDKVLARARTTGYVETLLGRRRYLPDLQSGQPQVRAGAERMAINMPIQGTSADIIKLAMNDLFQERLVQNAGCLLLLQVHDELLFEVDKNKLPAMAKKIVAIMEQAYKLRIPLRVEAKAGSNWNNMEKLNL